MDLTLRMDGYAWLFSVIISAMGALIALYAHYYLSAQDPVPRFFTFLLSFMGAMLGVVLAGNLIQLLVFWELTSLSSFMLIGYWHHRMDARRGARMALIVTGSGGFCLLASMLIIGHIVGSYDLDAVLAAATAIREHRWYPILLVLLALGALTKSAQFPFHFWLPNAMAAPTPVSAYLHSATMVKAGVFLLARFWPIFSGTDWWTWIIGGAGLCSLLLGAYAATFQRDMKGVLAYSTISHLGLITLLLGMSSRLALVAAVFHIINHATFKASLFMAAGIVDHESGTRDHGPPVRLADPDAAHRDAGHGLGRRHGGRPPAQRLHLQGNVLRGNRLHLRPLGQPLGPADRRRGRGRLQRGVLLALHPAGVLRSASDRPATHAA